MADLFRTRDHVADFDDYVRLYAERSAATRARRLSKPDLAYGPGEDEKLDLFFPDYLNSPAPIHLFVHGGYWRMFGKSDFSFVADTVSTTGAITAVMDYSLMPKVRMETIVAQVGKAMRYLSETAAVHGGDGSRISVSGHSAGAHLCALLLQEAEENQPVSTLLLSGVYDLAPLRQSFLQPELQLTDEEVQSFSPLNLKLKASGRVQILVGEEETSPFHEQAKALAEELGVSIGSVSERNHMSAALDLGNPQSQVGRALIATCMV